MKYSFLIFDIDGTLIDTEKTGVLSLQETIEVMMGKTLPYEEVYKFFGIPSHKVASLLNCPQEEEFASIWEHKFIEKRYLMKAFDGVETLLQTLSDVSLKLGVVTSRSRFELDSDPVFAAMAHRFDIAIGAEDSKRHKPDPDPVFEYIKRASALYGVDIELDKCLYIGDTMHDFKCANAAGVDFALADWRSRGLQGIPAQYRFSNCQELIKILDIN